MHPHNKTTVGKSISSVIMKLSLLPQTRNQQQTPLTSLNWTNRKIDNGRKSLPVLASLDESYDCIRVSVVIEWNIRLWFPSEKVQKLWKWVCEIDWWLWNKIIATRRFNNKIVAWNEGGQGKGEERARPGEAGRGLGEERASTAECKGVRRAREENARVWRLWKRKPGKVKFTNGNDRVSTVLALLP